MLATVWARRRLRLSEEDKAAAEAAIKEGLDWLDANREAGADELKEKQKAWEDVIKPILMKIYAASAGKTDPVAGETPAADGPRVEEVD